MRPVDITDQRFGRLVATAFTGRTRSGGRVWHCLCDCGAETDATAGELRFGHKLSCGCVQREAAARSCVDRSTHGRRATRLYTIWRAMVQRCEYPRGISYPRYGGRGIRICAEWRRSFEAFAVWAESAGYQAALSIDRVDSNGNYEPGNCRWATAKEQANNRNPPRARAA